MDFEATFTTSEIIAKDPKQAGKTILSNDAYAVSAMIAQLTELINDLNRQVRKNK